MTSFISLHSGDLSKSTAGNKGYHLSLLHKNGFSIPDGFVISSDQIREELSRSGKRDDLLNAIQSYNINNENDVDPCDIIKAISFSPDFVSAINTSIKSLTVDFVAVRSSSAKEDAENASGAGIYESYLNIRAKTADIVHAILKCWCSAFSRRAFTYRSSMGMDHEDVMAIIVQKMIPADLSGITFTIHPYDNDNILIEAGLGLGSNIVSGSITPNQYVYNRQTISHVKSTEYDRLLLTDEQLKQLCKVSLQIESLFKIPQDIEWCISQGSLWLLQTRPITAGNNNDNSSFLYGLGVSPGSATGNSFVIKNFQQLDKLNEGDILVAPMTNPDMTLAMSKCTGIVTDSGGMICHAAIIARELRIPCVVGVMNATTSIISGQKLTINGSTGTIQYIQPDNDNDVDRISTDPDSSFVIFGNHVVPFSASILRKHPIWEPIWDHDWPNIDETEIEWISPRPEIYGSFVQRSLISAGIEQIPYSLGYQELGPMYVRYHKNVAISYNTSANIIDRLKADLLSKNTGYYDRYYQMLNRQYDQFNHATEVAVKYFNSGANIADDYLIDLLQNWWRSHNSFFSTTYFLQVMGDDIVWPALRSQLSNYYSSDDDLLNALNVLTLPLSEKELVTSSKLALASSNLVFNAPGDISSLIRSNLDTKTCINIINSNDQMLPWTLRLQKHAQEWAWVPPCVRIDVASIKN